jgi:hypothetical protein
MSKTAKPLHGFLVLARLGFMVLGLLAGGLCGALIWSVLKWMAHDELIWGDVVTGGVAGAMLGGATGSGILRVTAWFAIDGAFVGAIGSFLLTRHGKAALFGAPIGAFMGLMLGLAREGGRSTNSKVPEPSSYEGVWDRNLDQ